MFIFTAPISTYVTVLFMDCLHGCNMDSVGGLLLISLYFGIPCSLVFGAFYAAIFKVLYGFISNKLIRAVALGPVLGGLIGISFILVLTQGFGSYMPVYLMALSAGSIAGLFCYLAAKNP